MSKQIWKPDTCDCIFEEDLSTTPKSASQIIRKCEAHASVPDGELYGVVYASPDGENRIKNELRAVLLEDPDLGEDVIVSGSTIRDFKSGLDFAYRWEGEGRDRVLVAQVIGAAVSALRRAAIDSRLANVGAANRARLE